MFWLAFLLILPGISGDLFAAEFTTVRILKKVSIDGDRILLGEIAEINGQDQELILKLKATVIGKAPMPGRVRRIDADYVKIRLRQRGINPSQIKFTAPETIEISRSFIEIPDEKIKKAVLAFVYENIPWDRSRVRIKDIRINQHVILPKGRITYRIVPPKRRDILGVVPLSVLFEVNGHFKKRIWATVNIEVTTGVVVTRRPLRRHQLITEGDIRIEERNLAGLPSHIITDYKEVLGRRTRRTINSNEVLRSDLIEFPPLVKRGDVVLIIAESDELRITALGKVKGKGHRGEMIEVINLDSNKLIYARVLDSNTVRVDF